MSAIPESIESCGDASMDREHSNQLNLLNDLKAALRGGAPDSLVYALLNDLVEHTNLHFLSEQLAMKLHAYEAYESHFLEHLGSEFVPKDLEKARKLYAIGCSDKFLLQQVREEACKSLKELSP